MKIGAEDKKKVAALAVFGLIALYLVYSNLISDGGTSTPPVVSQRRPAVEPGSAPQAAVTPEVPRSTPPRPLGSRNRSGDEFHPFIHKKGARPEDQQFNPNAIDPTLHTDLLAKVQGVKIEGGQRNLFQFGQAPAVETKLPDEPKIAVNKFVGPRQPPPPPPPPAPVIPTFTTSLKYYGLATKRIDNKRTGFFLNGEEIIFATEGMVIAQKYRVLRIGPDSVTMEDTLIKKTGTVMISEDAGGSGNS